MTETDIHEPHDGPVIIAKGLFSHTGGQSSRLFNTAIILAVLGLSIVALRIWISKRVINRWHPDDTLIITAAVFATLGSISAAINARLGAGTCIKDVDPRGLYILLENAKWAGIPAYNLATVFTKASVLMFYLRFTVDMHFIICAYAVLFIVVANCIFHTIAAIAYRCPAYEGGNCQAIVDIYTASAVINSVSDLILLLLPFWLLHPMKVPLSRKIGIALILMAGGFVLIVSIVRLVSTVKVDEDLDFTYSLGYGLLWSILEPWAGVICACLPCLKPIFTRWFPTAKARSWFSGSEKQATPSSVQVSFKTV
ncbi:integral membrane protein [Fusarium oxysporum f. sp. phaseoli]